MAERPGCHLTAELRRHGVLEYRIKRGVKRGGALRLALPIGQPEGRIAVQQINTVAYFLWGAGSCRLKSGRGEAWLVRLAAPQLTQARGGKLGARGIAAMAAGHPDGQAS